MNNSPVVTAVVVTYLSEDIVEKSLQALKQSYDEGLLECIVVDNASADGTVEYVRNHHDWAHLIANKTNLGYGRGCNCGLEAAGTDYVMFMNPDVVIKPPAIRKMVQFMEEHPLAGIIGPATVYGLEKYQAVGMLPSPRDIIAKAIGYRNPAVGKVIVKPGDPPLRTDWLCGAIMLARKSLVDELGGFDPRFFLYFEETDLCLRVMKAGYELNVVGEAVAYHEPNSSARNVDPDLPMGGCIPKHYFESRFYYLEKHYGWLAAVSAEIGELAILAGKDTLKKIFRKRGGEFRDRLRAPFFRRPAKV